MTGAAASQRLVCPCGSGLRPVRCCQLDYAGLAPPEASRHLLPLVDKAIAAQRRNDNEEAEKLCLEVLELAPGQGGALAVLYRIRRAQGVLPAAEALCRRLVRLQPNNLWATQELALLLFGNGDLNDAEHHARNAVRIAPTDPQSHNLMGMILTEANRPQIGEYHYRQALALSGAARSDPARQPCLEPEEPGQDGRSARALRGIGRARARRSCRRCSARHGWKRPTATSPAPTHSRPGRALAPGNPNVLLQRAVPARPHRAYDAALGDSRPIAARRGHGLGAGELNARKAGCSTRWAATTKPSPPSPKASACCGSSRGNVYLADAGCCNSRPG